MTSGSMFVSMLSSVILVSPDFSFSVLKTKFSSLKFSFIQRSRTRFFISTATDWTTTTQVISALTQHSQFCTSVRGLLEGIILTLATKTSSPCHDPSNYGVTLRGPQNISWGMRKTMIDTHTMIDTLSVSEMDSLSRRMGLSTERDSEKNFPFVGGPKP